MNSSMSQPSDQRDVQTQICRILQAHRDGHYDQDKTTYLLERTICRETEEIRRHSFETLWLILSTEPLSSETQRGGFIPCVQAAIVRSIAQFGPTAELPERVFALLRSDVAPERTEFWARSICPPLVYNVFHNQARFTPETLDRFKELCSVHLSSDTSPNPTHETFAFAVTSLADAITSIEAARFAAEIESQHASSEEEPMTLKQDGASDIHKAGRTKIFIGHGRSLLWKELKDFLHDRLFLDWDEFNREPVAGYSTKERLETMLYNAAFAFLVMTADDAGADGAKHARENVIHEVGLFQGHLGFERAIILLEEGCAEFSNIHGLTQIRFPKGDVAARFEDIRKVLEREGIIGNRGNPMPQPAFH